VLRSKSPELVQQEIWGHLCCHYAIRTLMAEAAHHSGNDPDRISFVAALRIARQSIAPRGASPLTTPPPATGSGSTRSPGSCTGSTRPADYARHPG